MSPLRPRRRWCPCPVCRDTTPRTRVSGDLIRMLAAIAALAALIVLAAHIP